MNFDLKEIFVFAERYKLVLLFLSILLSNILTFYFSKTYVLASATASDMELTETVEVSEPPSIVTVDVSGAVKHPGVYSLPEFARINDALALSGGLSDESSKMWVLRNLNLSQPLKDAQKIYVPFESDTEEVCQAYTIDTLIGVTTITDETQSEITTPTTNPTPTETINRDDLLNVNISSKEELDTLPGIGEVFAQKIIDLRPFKDIQELQEKTKIPQSTITKITPLITF